MLPSCPGTARCASGAGRTAPAASAHPAPAAPAALRPRRPDGIIVAIAEFDLTWPELHVGLWVIWLVAAVVLGIAEMLTTTLALGLLAVGALAAAITGGLGAGI